MTERKHITTFVGEGFVSILELISLVWTKLGENKRWCQRKRPEEAKKRVDLCSKPERKGESN